MDSFSIGPNEMDLLNSAANGMSVQRSLLDVAARNVAAAQASTPDHPYSRLVARFGPAAESSAADDDDAIGDESLMTQTPSVGMNLRSETGTGDALTEMIAVLDAQRAYEQNASVFDTAKRLAERTIDIGRS